ncbi:hypothetical protein Vafri_17249, partial [Volvox africanus]
LRSAGLSYVSSGRVALNAAHSASRRLRERRRRSALLSFPLAVPSSNAAVASASRARAAASPAGPPPVSLPFRTSLPMPSLPPPSPPATAAHAAAAAAARSAASSARVSSDSLAVRKVVTTLPLRNEYS